MDYTNKALGLRVQTQIPLNVKAYKESENDLKNLGLNNNLAFTYEKGLIVYCIEEGTRYEWKEMEVGDVGLLPSNFTYPPNIITFGIDYSNKEYNFVLYGRTIPVINPGLQEVLDVSGEATLLYVDGDEQYINTTSINYTTSKLSTLFLDGDNTHTKYSEIVLQEGELTFKQSNGINHGTTVAFTPATVRSRLLFPAKTIQDGEFTIATTDDIPILPPPPDGSETKINVGNRMTKTGNGTIATPFDLNSIPPTLISGVTTVLSGDGFTTPYKVETVNLQKAITGDYTILTADNNYSIKINNGATAITITVPAGLPANFFAGFTQKGTGDVTFVGSGGVTISNPIGLKMKGQGYCVGLEQIGTSNNFDLLADTKA